MITTRRAIVSLWILLLLSASSPTLQSKPTVCIIGSGIGGSSVAHFLRRYSHEPARILMFERNDVVGGRMATVNISGDIVEVGGTILLPKNYHVVNYTDYLNLKREAASWSSFGVWDGKKVALRTGSGGWKLPIVEKMVSSVYFSVRYGLSFLKMQTFIEDALGRFLKYYQDPEERPVFESVEEMLKWAGLYNLTSNTLEDESCENSIFGFGLGLMLGGDYFLAESSKCIGPASGKNLSSASLQDLVGVGWHRRSLKQRIWRGRKQGRCENEGGLRKVERS